MGKDAEYEKAHMKISDSVCKDLYSMTIEKPAQNVFLHSTAQPSTFM